MKCPHCGKEINRTPAFNVIENYYRRKAAGAKRITLHLMAEETGYSADYLRKAKQRYDKALLWGSKK